jgi:hypothetical protein
MFVYKLKISKLYHYFVCIYRTCFYFGYNFRFINEKNIIYIIKNINIKNDEFKHQQ